MTPATPDRRLLIEGLLLFRCIPSLRAAVRTPPELATVINLFPWSSSAAFPVPRAGRPPDVCFNEACMTFDACGPQRRSPAFLRVCRRAPRRAFATPARPPSFVAVVPCHVEIFHSRVAPPFIRSLRGSARWRGAVVRGVAVSDDVGASILATARFQRPPVTPDTEISTIRRCPSSQYDVYGALPLGSLHQVTP